MAATWYVKLVGVSWFLLVVIISEYPVKGQTIDDMISKELERAPNGHRSGLSSFPSQTSSKTFYLMQLDMLLTKKQWKRIKAANKRNINGALSRQKRKGTKNRDQLWKEETVPYEITEGDFDLIEESLIKEAINVWQINTCVTFIPIKHLQNKGMPGIRFRQPSEAGCNSYVGQTYRNRAQDINLGRFCLTKPIIVHEIGHALGLYHEHMRPDRKEYVKINMENVLEGQYNNFDKLEETDVDVETVPYDLVSIMHYGKLFMSKNKTANLYTIEPHDPEYLDVIGKAESASFTDINMVNHMYKCAARCSINITCPPDGFLGKNCRCFCPSNSDGTAAVDCRYRNRCEPPDVNGPYTYVHPHESQWEDVHANESRMVEHTMLYALCKGNTNDELGNLTCINGTWTGYLPDCISGISQCAQEKDRGTCSTWEIKWFYDTSINRCDKFWYGSCGGNDNRFNDEVECKAACLSGRARCDINPTDTLLVTVDDERFEGTKVEHGTRVMFSCINGYEFIESTHRSISASCSKGELNQPTCRPSISQCAQEKDRGTCSTWETKWFYDTSINRCDKFWYGSCGGNDNRFNDEVECKAACLSGRARCDINPTDTLLVTVDDERFEGTKVEHGTRVMFSCINGYEFIESTHRSISASCSKGELNQPTCRPKDCSVPAVEKGRMYYEGHNYRPLQEFALHGYRVAVKCSQGYELIRGQTYLNTFQTTCQLGNFTHYPLASCVEARCDINPSDTLLVAVDDERSEGMKVEHETRVSFSCRNGYEFTESTHRSINVSCSKGELNQPTCRPTRCDINPTDTLLVTVDDERFEGTKVEHGTRVMFSCINGYEFIESTHRSISASCSKGELNQPTCRPKDCSVPAVEKGRMYYEGHNYRPLQEFALHGYRVAVKCSQGYELIRGQTYLNTFQTTCQLGNFTHYPLASCVEARCDINPSDTLLVAVDDERSEGMKVEHETRVSFSCRNGYEFTESTHRSINVSCSKGELNQPTCRPIVTCPPLPSLMHGERYQDTFTHERDTHGSVVENTCRSGFLLRGGSTQTCQGDGTWSEEPAVCQEISCGISDVGQGIMKSHESLWGINFIYCFENATYSGDDDAGLIRCTENGWTEGYCYANCILEEMDNGVILEARTINHDEELHWRCPENYVKPFEIRDVTCYNGTLTTRPSCQHVRSDPGISCLSTMPGDQAYPYGDTCYYLLTYDYDSKQDAMSACLRKYSAKLVTVRHQNNWHFLQIVKRHAGWGSKDVWLGLRWDRDTWKWDNGETVGRFSSTLWQEGEGRNRLPVKWKRCANMEGDANWRWNDEYCSSVFRPMSVICEGSRRSDV